ncbi:MAG: SGNH/GDSL hydrolase family protein [Bacilli bacterium]
MKTVFVGDSLTSGLPGVSYWKHLKDKTNLINKGIGGDTLFGVTKRINRMLSNHKYDDIEKYIIEVGANDILVPILEEHSKYWDKFVDLKKEVLNCIPTNNINKFEEQYEELIRLLKSHNKKIGIIGLPIVENDDLGIDEKFKEYNIIVKKLAKKHNISYVDLRKMEEELKTKKGNLYVWGKTNMGLMLDTVKTSVLPFSMQISQKRELEVTVDSIHLNELAAKKLAELIEDSLL